MSKGNWNRLIVWLSPALCVIAAFVLAVLRVDGWQTFLSAGVLFMILAMIVGFIYD